MEKIADANPEPIYYDIASNLRAELSRYRDSYPYAKAVATKENYFYLYRLLKIHIRCHEQQLKSERNFPLIFRIQITHTLFLSLR